MPEKPPIPLRRRFLRQFQSPLIYILLFALAVELLIWFSEDLRGVPVESLTSALILLLNAGLGVYQESKAETALAKLKALAAALVWTLRDNQLMQVPSTASPATTSDWKQATAFRRMATGKPATACSWTKPC